MQTTSRIALWVMAGAGLLLLLTLWVRFDKATDPAPVAEGSGSERATHAGTATCAGCHGEQYHRWRGSHHELAMQPATRETVLGDFDDAVLEHFGVATRFFRRGEGYWVETANAEGKSQAFEIAYTFGAYPLQQYLIGFADGRYQALTVAWDSRPKATGGQRWFHLQPDEPVPREDPLHWTGPYFNWNSRCAECHSTGLQKNYDESSNTYATTWAEINVGCEACHGPGSRHVRWAQAGGKDGERASNKGLLAPGIGAVGRWVRDARALTAHRVEDANSPAASSRQLDACGACHSRRQVIAAPDHGQPLPRYHDANSLTLPVPPIYHADGQLRDEAYELGSFMQSRMHAAGVVCGDCHDPHSLQLKASGNAVCAQCHDPAAFDTRAHHHHGEGTPGAQCANCHMPETTYMVVDQRRDHSLRIPRPDLSVKHGTPNACTHCHSERSAGWAAERVVQWLGASGKSLRGHFSEQLTSGDATDLAQLAADASAPGIARAAALTRLAQRPHGEAVLAARNQLRDSDALVRRGAVTVFAALEPEQRLQSLWPLVNDPVRSVRVEVARLLAPLDLASLDEEQRTALSKLFDEYVTAQQAAADLPGNQVDLGLFYLERGDPQRAEQAYRLALRLDPQFVGAFLNLADLNRQNGNEDEARQLLERALRAAPESAAAHHAFGLQRARSRAYPEALEHLRRAHQLAPADAGYGYIYAIALFDTGSPDEAIAVLQRLVNDHPQDTRVRQALVDYLFRGGRFDDALTEAERLLTLTGNDPRLQEWVAELRRRMGAKR